MEATAVSLFRQTTQASPPPGLIDFGIGQPQPALLPLEIMRRAAQQRLAEEDPTLLAYGFEQGDGRFRTALADFLTARYKTAVDPNQLMVTTGASQALDLICTLYTRPGDTIFVEEPTYFLALRIFADHGLRVIGLPTDEQGLIPEAVAEQLAYHQPKLLYTIPTFQNPGGFTLPRQRRQQLVQLSAAHQMLLVADEVYHLLDFGAPPPKPFAHYIADGPVLSLGSFSKILAPGLRLGWMQGAAQWLRPLLICGLLDSGAGLNPFTANLVRVALEAGWQAEYLDEIKAIYRDRADLMGLLLRYHLGERVCFTKPQGGYFYWVTCRDGVDTAVLHQQASAQQVSFQPGCRFYSHTQPSTALRLSYAYWSSEQIEEGIARLARLF